MRVCHAHQEPIVIRLVLSIILTALTVIQDFIAAMLGHQVSFCMNNMLQVGIGVGNGGG